MLGGVLYGLTLPGFSYMVGSGQLYIVLLLIVPIAAIVGTLIGGVIWWAHAKSGKNIGTLLRALIGAGFTIVLAGFLSIIGAMDSHTNHDQTEKASWGKSEVLYLSILGILVGAVPGIIVGSQNQEEQ